MIGHLIANPREHRKSCPPPESDNMPALDKKHVVVCGAGLVGCLAALILAKRGYDGT